MKTLINFKFPKIRFTYSLFFTLAIILGTLSQSGCVNTAASPDAGAGEAIWEARDQFVKMIPAEANATNPNQHPVKIDSEALFAALSTIEIEPKNNKMKNDLMLPLLDERALRYFAINLSDALAQAKPEQDIVFAVHTIVEGSKLGLEKVSVSGRVFYTDNTLNLIIGDLFVAVLPKEFYTSKVKPTFIDRSIHPHKLGSRTMTSEYKGYNIKPPHKSKMQAMSLKRVDWISFNNKIQSTEFLSHHKMKQNASKHAPNKTTEERLQDLEKLKHKKLISKDEYKAIKARILSEL
jgi:hypothetical protein